MSQLKHIGTEMDTQHFPDQINMEFRLRSTPGPRAGYFNIDFIGGPDTPPFVQDILIGYSFNVHFPGWEYSLLNEPTFDILYAFCSEYGYVYPFAQGINYCNRIERCVLTKSR